MNAVFDRFLFEKHILIAHGRNEENPFEVLLALANLYGVIITEGDRHAEREMLVTVGECFGNHVPEPFYRAFPASVRGLSKEQLEFDRLLHYFLTYDLGHFDKAGHSIFEEDIARLAFREHTVAKRFVILTEEQALEVIRTYVDEMLSSSRPLSRHAFEVLVTYVTEYGYHPENIRSKDTATALLTATRDLYFARFLNLSDVVRLVEHINFKVYNNRNVRKLNFKNADRKFVVSVMDVIFENGFVNIRDCFEKKAIWCGLLHHIHYQPSCEAAEKFCHLMRNKGNQSVSSELERYMSERDVRRAVDLLKAKKGAGAVLRSLDYLVSRCRTEDDVTYVVDALDRGKPILLVQLLMHYANYSAGERRTFRFVKNGLSVKHVETDEEMKRRRTVLSETDTARIAARMKELLTEMLRGKLGKVYIDPRMNKMAIPLHEASANGGFGCMPSGSRVPIDAGDKIRAFTYWEKVNDVDLSVIAIDKFGGEHEFSWRTMYFNEDNEMITFSGDQTAGYDGGSEYFDINLDLIRKRHPEYNYLVLCNNVYTGTPFSECVCRAGYMTREIIDSGEVFEPKTVKSSFVIDCPSTYAYLYAIDLRTHELVWLNVAFGSFARIAGTDEVGHILGRIYELEVLSAGELIALAATELVDNPDDADLAFTDELLEEKEGRRQLHSYDYEAILSLLG